MHPDFSHQLANRRRAESNDRGILGMEDEVPPGRLSLATRVRISGNASSRESCSSLSHGPINTHRSLTRSAGPSRRAFTWSWQRGNRHETRCDRG
jgi:hypothetical protein